MNINLQKFINYIVVFTIFGSGFDLSGIFSFADFRISYLLILFALLLWLPFLKGIYFNKFFLFFFSLIVIFSLYNVYIEKDTIGLLTKQVIGISLNAFIFYLLVKINKYDVKRLFKIYLNIAFLIALIGLIQELSYLLGFKAGYDFSYILPSWKVDISGTGFLRVNSILPEPASFCYSMMPAFFVALTSFSKKNFKFLGKWKSLVIISSFFLTFSTVGYIGITTSLFLLIYNYRRRIGYVFLGAISIFLLIFFLWNNISDFRMRIDDSVNVLTGKASLETVNLSTFTLFSNALVAYNSFKDNPVFGSGLGSHQISYYKYIGQVIDVDELSTFLNFNDANSLFLRLLSETGLFGLLIVLFFIFRFYLSRGKDKTDYLWIINNAVLVMFLIRLIRSGHYFIYGFFFFFWLYYFTWKSNRAIKSKPQLSTQS